MNKIGYGYVKTVKVEKKSVQKTDNDFVNSIINLKGLIKLHPKKKRILKIFINLKKNSWKKNNLAILAQK